jgi:hypothetical protein
VHTYPTTHARQRLAHRVVRARVLLNLVTAIMAVSLVMQAPAGRVEAAWQPGQITEGDGHGGSIAHPACKQELFAGPAGSKTMPFGLVQMNNGQIAMAASWQASDGVTHPVIGFSTDGGGSWSPFQTIPPFSGDANAARPMMLTYLGGSNLSYVAGRSVYFSNDYGQHWGQPVSYGLGAGYTNSAEEGNAGVDRDPNGNAVRVNEIGYSWNGNGNNSYPYTSTFGYSTDGGVTWQGKVTPPAWTYPVTYQGTQYTRGTSEGSVVRAANGDLVAALRTDGLPQYEALLPNDDVEGLAVSISKDNGQTWSALSRLFDAGRHHANLQLLPNGDLLMTMIVRHDFRTGTTLTSNMRGCDALLSHDNGLTWNLDQRITLDAFDYYDPSNLYPSVCGHVAFTPLSDGSMLTAYGKYVDNAAVLVKWNPMDCPEPSACWLVATALIAIAVYAWRKQR